MSVEDSVTKEELREAVALIRKEINSEGKETRRHFDVVAENIHRDLAGANADEISLMKGHVRRIEQRLGIDPMIEP